MYHVHKCSAVCRTGIYYAYWSVATWLPTSQTANSKYYIKTQTQFWYVQSSKCNTVFPHIVCIVKIRPDSFRSLGKVVMMDCLCCGELPVQSYCKSMRWWWCLDRQIDRQ